MLSKKLEDVIADKVMIVLGIDTEDIDDAKRVMLDGELVVLDN